MLFPSAVPNNSIGPIGLNVSDQDYSKPPVEPGNDLSAPRSTTPAQFPGISSATPDLPLGISQLSLSENFHAGFLHFTRIHLKNVQQKNSLAGILEKLKKAYESEHIQAIEKASEELREFCWPSKMKNHDLIFSLVGSSYYNVYHAMLALKSSLAFCEWPEDKVRERRNMAEFLIKAIHPNKIKRCELLDVLRKASWKTALDRAALYGDNAAVKGLFECGVYSDLFIFENEQLPIINITPESLKLGNYLMGDDRAKGLAAVLQGNTNVTSLCLGNNQLGPAGAGFVAKILDGNSTLKHLSVFANNLGDDGAEKLIAGLKDNTTLTYLDLSANAISSKGAESIAAILRKNTSLTCLDLGQNQLGDEGVQKIIESLEENQQISLTLRIGENGVSRGYSNTCLVKYIASPRLCIRL